MTRIKLCGLSRIRDIEAANALAPDYVGFVFAENSRRYVTPEQAAALKSRLAPGIAAVGVFVDEKPETVARLMNRGVIDMAQLHGSETEDYVRLLRTLTDKPLLQAFRIHSAPDCRRAAASSADYVLLDSGAGTGRAFDWELVREVGGRTSSPAGWTRRTSGARFCACIPMRLTSAPGLRRTEARIGEKWKNLVRIVREADGRGE